MQAALRRPDSTADDRVADNKIGRHRTELLDVKAVRES
jgi:hypothetical protein